MNHVTVIGAGLAGSECAWQLAQRGIPVTLREMKPEKMTPAHQTADFAELCCSNSLRLLPSPSTYPRTGYPSAFNCRIASIATGYAFCGASLPTVSRRIPSKSSVNPPGCPDIFRIFSQSIRL